MTTGKGIAITNAEVERMRDLRRNGMSLNTIANETGRAISAIQKHIKGIPSSFPHLVANPKRIAARAAGCDANEVPCPQCGQPKRRYAKLCLVCHMSQRVAKTVVMKTRNVRLPSTQRVESSTPQMRSTAHSPVAQLNEVGRAESVEQSRLWRPLATSGDPPIAPDAPDCIHHWVLDTRNYGVCQKCSAERLFVPRFIHHATTMAVP